MRMVFLSGLAFAALAFPVRAAELRLPAKPFAAMAKPPAPDYKDNAAWLVWPDRPSNADVIPKGIDGTKARDPAVDVFYIHPTTYLSNAAWNARFDEGGETGKQLEFGPLQYQASVFNGCCRIFAPRYRQATISTFLSVAPDSFRAYDLAYGDVLRAFDFYMMTQNRGRPFFIASHSQGSLHATRLLRERIANNTELKQKLVAAYVVGASLPVSEVPLPVCESAQQTGCIVGWNSTSPRTLLAFGRGVMITYNSGAYKPVGLQTWLCVNPLSWTRAGNSPPVANKGALPGVKPGDATPSVIAGVTGTRCDRGRAVVFIPPEKRTGFVDLLTKFGSYHNHDYNLFYASVRQNALDRTNAYLGQRR